MARVTSHWHKIWSPSLRLGGFENISNGFSLLCAVILLLLQILSYSISTLIAYHHHHFAQRDKHVSYIERMHCARSAIPRKWCGTFPGLSKRTYSVSKISMFVGVHKQDIGPTLHESVSTGYPVLQWGPTIRGTASTILCSNVGQPCTSRFSETDPTWAESKISGKPASDSANGHEKPLDAMYFLAW